MYAAVVGISLSVLAFLFCETERLEGSTRAIDDEILKASFGQKCYGIEDFPFKQSRV